MLIYIYKKGVILIIVLLYLYAYRVKALIFLPCKKIKAREMVPVKVKYAAHT